MKRPLLTITRSRQLSALCWVVLLLFGALSRWFTIRDLPVPLRIGAAVLLSAASVVIMLTSMGVWVEKGDERSAENDRRARAALFTLLVLAVAVLLLWMQDGQTITLGRAEVLTVFGCVWLAQDILFLLYERFGA